MCGNKNQRKKFSIKAIAVGIRQASLRIKPHIIETPCVKSKLLSDELDSDVFLKLENKQITGSFKLRGVCNKILTLSRSQQSQLLIAASTGNHGVAFAHIVNTLGLNGRLFVPKNIKPVKLSAIQDTDIEVVQVGDDCVQTEMYAIEEVKKHGGIFVGPYNDWDVIQGQGTVAAELMRQLDKIDAVIVPVGGGGLISGIVAFIKQISPKTQVIGCQPENSPVMLRSIQAGKIISMESFPTLSDATAGGIEPGSITFDLCRKYVDDFVLVNEKEIASAMLLIKNHENMLIEGGAALSVAALCKQKHRFKKQHVALVITGGKIDKFILDAIERGEL